MAIGAVAVSLPFAFFGLWYVSLLNDLALWQGLVAYSGLGSTVIFGILFLAMIQDAGGRI